MSDGWVYPSTKSPIPPKSRVIFYTDGLEEAFPSDDQRHEQFGVQGIIRTLQANCERPLEDVLQALFDESHAATKGAGRLDDTSIMVVERYE